MEKGRIQNTKNWRSGSLHELYGFILQDPDYEGMPGGGLPGKRIECVTDEGLIWMLALGLKVENPG